MSSKFFIFLVVVFVVKTEDFFELKERDEVLLDCDDLVDGIAFKLPSLPNCTIPKLEEESTTIVLTTYWADKSNHPISGVECWKESFTNVVTESFFGFYTPL